MVSTQRRSGSPRSEIARRLLMARIPVSGVRTSWANEARAASITRGAAFAAARLRDGLALVLEMRLLDRRFFGVRILRFERDFAAMVPLTPRRTRMPWPGRRSHGRFISPAGAHPVTADRPDA